MPFTMFQLSVRDDLCGPISLLSVAREALSQMCCIWCQPVPKPADQRPQCVICCGAAHCDKLDLDDIRHGHSQWSLVHINHSRICQRPISLQVRPREREGERGSERPQVKFQGLKLSMSKGSKTLTWVVIQEILCQIKWHQYFRGVWNNHIMALQTFKGNREITWLV